MDTANLLYCCVFKTSAVQTVKTANSAANSNKTNLLCTQRRMKTNSWREELFYKLFNYLYGSAEICVHASFPTHTLILMQGENIETCGHN
ncbi:MAG: hypothetical protein DKT66_28025 [Candidatus Melainabacteria bacterium]|nr:MAG: hypothetical protein DKT66_28025 [Candidatus Melainabacteria bacterium]